MIKKRPLFMSLAFALYSTSFNSLPSNADTAGNQWRALEKTANAPENVANADAECAIWQKAYEIAKTFGEKDLRLATTYMRLGMYQVARTATDLANKVKAGAPYQIMMTGLSEAEDQALDYYQRALSIRINALGPNSPDVGYCYLMIGGVYQSKQNNEMARLNYQKCLDIFEDAFGPDGEDLVQPLMQLAGLCISADPAQAAKYYTRVVAIEEKHLAPDSPRWPGLLTVLGAFKQRQGKFSDAGQLFRRAMAIRDRQPSYERPPDNTPEYLAYCNRMLNKSREIEQAPPEEPRPPKTQFSPQTISTPPINTNPAQQQQQQQQQQPPKGPQEQEEIPPPRAGATYTLNGKSISYKTYQACLLTRHGNELMNKNENPQAADLFRKAIALDPKYSIAQCELGLSLLRNGNSDDATAYLKEAARLDPTMFPAWCGLVADYKLNGHLEDAVATMKECQKRFPSESAQFKFDSGIHLVQRELNGRALVPPSQVLATDYYSDAVRESKSIWAQDRMPLKIYVRDGYGIKGFGKDFPDIFRNCFDTWVGASNEKLSVKYVDQADGADIDVVWADDSGKVNEAAEGGDAKTFVNQDGIQRVTISLLTVTPPNNALVTDDEMKFVCYHEIGHSLGIHGHSRDPHDVMYFSEPLRITQPALTARDLRTIAKLYGNK